MGNTIEIDLNDYITEDERKEMARDVFRAACDRQSQQDFERILSNSAYQLVARIVDEHFDGEMIETVKARAIDVINGMTSSTVFSAPNAWDRAASKGFQHLQSAVDSSKDMIRSRVESIISGYDSEDLREMVERQVGSAIIRKLTAGSDCDE